MRQSEEFPREWTRVALLEYLIQQGIDFEEAIHGAVFTMAESAALGITLAGSRCKNLLVSGKRGAHRFLVVTEPNASIDLGALGRVVGAGRLSLCPPEDMRRMLHVTPGALSPLALVADAGKSEIRLLFDESLRSRPRFLFHPLVNTSTISISSNHLENFVQSTGHAIEYVNMPARPFAAE